METTVPRPPRSLLSRMGPDGLLMLAASLLVAAATGGVSLLAAAGWVARRGAAAGVDDPGARWIFIFGMRLVGDRPGEDYRLRLERGLSLARAHPMAPVIILGGYTGGSVSEAECGRRYLVERGVEGRRIVVEERSTHSLENLREAREILRAKGVTTPVTVVSNRYHLARIETLAEGLSLPVVPCGAEERMGWDPTTLWTLFREGLFLHWYHTGRIISHLIRSRHMIDRIT
ncbi:MAG: YdcF family protein [Nitrospinae bacterium]|nr:YdcF family protein [Nitrospinota bacterium]